MHPETTPSGVDEHDTHVPSQRPPAPCPSSHPAEPSPSSAPVLSEPSLSSAASPSEPPPSAPALSSAPVPSEPSLSERELKILAFESKWWRHAGSKEQAIRDTFELSSTRYYQLLNALLDNPDALVHDPVLVGRLRRLRSTRARSRRR
jgi:hypothetical protein